MPTTVIINTGFDAVVINQYWNVFYQNILFTYLASFSVNYY